MAPDTMTVKSKIQSSLTRWGGCPRYAPAGPVQSLPVVVVAAVDATDDLHLPSPEEDPPDIALETS